MEHEPTRQVAAETMLGDLMHTVIDMAKALQKPWQQLGEKEQSDWIESIEKQCETAAKRVVEIIASGGRTTVVATLKSVSFKGDGVAAQVIVDRTSNHRIELADAAGQLVHLVITDPDACGGGGGKPKAEPDQPALSLEEEERDVQEEGPDTMYGIAVDFVRRTRKCTISGIQRGLAIGYNRAARLLERMEAEKVVTPARADGKREVLLPAPEGEGEA